MRRSVGLFRRVSIWLLLCPSLALAESVIAPGAKAAETVDETASAPTSVGSPAGSPGAPIKVDGRDVSQLSAIEDATLEGLMNLNLEDKLGQTEAVSRTNESILLAPATITTLDAAQIRLSGASTVPDVLRFVPGVTVIRNAPGNYVVSLRGTGGLASNNIILLVDGIALNNPL